MTHRLLKDLKKYSRIITSTSFFLEPQEEVESLKSWKSVTIEVEESQNVEKENKSSGCTYTWEYGNIWTLVLLSRLSHSNDPIDRLADPTTIGPLLAYIRHAKNLRASRILNRIIR